jgi:hypothetical protein
LAIFAAIGRDRGQQTDMKRMLTVGVTLIGVMLVAALLAHLL